MKYSLLNISVFMGISKVLILKMLYQIDICIDTENICFIYFNSAKNIDCSFRAIFLLIKDSQKLSINS